MIVHPESDFDPHAEDGVTVMSAEASSLLRGLDVPSFLWVEVRLSVEKFELHSTRRDRDNDVECWLFTPVRPDLRGKVVLMVFND